MFVIVRKFMQLDNLTKHAAFEEKEYQTGKKLRTELKQIQHKISNVIILCSVWNTIHSC